MLSFLYVTSVLQKYYNFITFSKKVLQKGILIVYNIDIQRHKKIWNETNIVRRIRQVEQNKQDNKSNNANRKMNNKRKKRE